MRNSKHKKIKGIAKWLDKKVEKNKHKIEKFGFWGLVLFVGIPLPGTGAWTGCLIAALLNMRKVGCQKHLYCLKQFRILNFVLHQYSPPFP